VVFRVLRVGPDQVLELGGGGRVFVLEHEVERRLGARPGRLGPDGIAGRKQGSSNKEYRAAPPHGTSLSVAY